MKREKPALLPKFLLVPTLIVSACSAEIPGGPAAELGIEETVSPVESSTAIDSLEPTESEPSEDPSATVVTGVVPLLEMEGVTRICWAWGESMPPYCKHGPVVEGEIDWKAIAGEHGNYDVRWQTNVRVEGKYRDGVLSLSDLPTLAADESGELPTPRNRASLADIRAVRSAVYTQFESEFQQGLLYDRLVGADDASGSLVFVLIGPDPVVERGIRELAKAKLPEGSWLITRMLDAQ